MKYKVWCFKHGKFSGIIYHNKTNDFSKKLAEKLMKLHKDGANKYDNEEFIIQSADIKVPFRGMEYDNSPMQNIEYWRK